MIGALALALLCTQAAQSEFAGELWGSIGPVYAKTIEHPFLQGLTKGTLPKERFRYYLLQDRKYLTEFARALNLLAAKAPREDWAATLSRHAIEAIQAERELHDKVLASYGVAAAERDATGMEPANYAYTRHLLATVQEGSFLEGLSALLPCYWIYWEVGKHLARQGSPDPAYKRWIEQYSAPGYGDTVHQVLTMANVTARSATRAERERAKRNFLLSSRYEYLFWDAAWRLERWQP